MTGERAQQVAQLQEMVDASHSIVFFGGAGVSTESGIPDFRSTDGLYSQQYDYPPEQILSATFYHQHKAAFFEFYRAKILAYRHAKPNPAHEKLAALEQAGRLSAVITQNIDGLHQAAGSQNVVELHGSIHRNTCRRCGKHYDADFMAGTPADKGTAVPICGCGGKGVGPAPTLPEGKWSPPLASQAAQRRGQATSCGGDIKPDVVLYGESLDTRAIEAAVRYISGADCLIIGGTSLVVHPAAGLVDYYQGNRLVVINKTPTHMDRRADLLIADSIGEVFAALKVPQG